MTVVEWFGVGVGCAGALWWWRFICQKAIWWTEEGRERDDPPDALEGILGGTIAWVLSPVWVPIYAIHKVWTGQVHVLRRFGQRTNAALLRAFPERRSS